MYSYVLFQNNENEADARDMLLAETGNRFQSGTKLMKYIRSLMGGNRSSKAIVGVNAARASATLTGTSVVATDAISVNNVTFTAVASGATGNQFNIGADDTETMANLAAAINASATAAVNTIVTAESSGTVVTVYAARPGYIGNAITLSSADATIVASAARLAGGDDGAYSKTHYYGSAS